MLKPSVVTTATELHGAIVEPPADVHDFQLQRQCAESGSRSDPEARAKRIAERRSKVAPGSAIYPPGHDTGRDKHGEGA